MLYHIDADYMKYADYMNDCFWESYCLYVCGGLWIGIESVMIHSVIKIKLL